MRKYGSEEVCNRLNDYREKIDKEFPDMNTADKSIKLLRMVIDVGDIECVNVFSRLMGNVAKKYNNEFCVDVCKKLKNLTTKHIFLTDQKKEN